MIAFQLPALPADRGDVRCGNEYDELGRELRHGRHQFAGFLRHGNNAIVAFHAALHSGGFSPAVIDDQDPCRLCCHFFAHQVLLPSRLAIQSTCGIVTGKRALVVGCLLLANGRQTGNTGAKPGRPRRCD